MTTTRRPLAFGWFTLFISIALPRASADTTDALTATGHILMLRHAQAPGVGDPPGMTLDDCSSQRNLDAAGQSQARSLGDRLRAAGLAHAEIYTSQWCRCRETARLLNLGPAQDLPALNSFFNSPELRESRIKALRVFIDQLPRDGRTVIFVTHQMTITGLTGEFPTSGEGLILRLREGGGFDRVAEFPAD